VCGGVESSRQDLPRSEPAHNPGLNSAAGESVGKRFGFCTPGGVREGGWEEAGNERWGMERRWVGANDRGTGGEVGLENHGASAFFIAPIPFETGLCSSVRKKFFPPLKRSQVDEFRGHGGPRLSGRSLSIKIMGNPQRGQHGEGEEAAASSSWDTPGGWASVWPGSPPKAQRSVSKVWRFLG
jgi:hypothetical protein